MSASQWEVLWETKWSLRCVSPSCFHSHEDPTLNTTCLYTYTSIYVCEGVWWKKLWQGGKAINGGEKAENVMECNDKEADMGLTQGLKESSLSREEAMREGKGWEENVRTHLKIPWKPLLHSLT